MKPYVPSRSTALNDEEKIFNYRLSRARRCIENAFGILTRKWLCLSQPLRHSPSTSSKIVLACCNLHNLLINNENYCPRSFADHYNKDQILIEGEWRRHGNNMTPLQAAEGRGRQISRAKNIRDDLKRFVNSSYGSVSWQSSCTSSGNVNNV